MKKWVCLFLLTGMALGLYAQPSRDVRLQSFDGRGVVGVQCYGNRLVMLEEKELPNYKNALTLVGCDLSGKVSWSRELVDTSVSLESLDFLHRDDTCFILVKEGENHLLFVYGRNGELIRRVSLNPDVNPTCLFSLDQGIGIAGAGGALPTPEEAAEGSTRNNGALAMLDTSGEMGDPLIIPLHGNQWVTSVKQNKGSGDWLVAESSDYANRKSSAQLVSMTREGRIKWLYTTHSTVPEFDKQHQPKVDLLSVDKILFSWTGGNYNNKNEAANVVCLDGNGKKQWAWSSSSDSNVEIDHLTVIDPDKILVSGHSTLPTSDNSTSYHGFIMLLDGAGRMVWTKPMPVFAAFGAISLLPDNRLLIVGAEGDPSNGYSGAAADIVLHTTTLVESGGLPSGTEEGWAQHFRYQLLDEVALSSGPLVSEAGFKQSDDEPKGMDWLITKKGWVFSGLDEQGLPAIFGAYKNGKQKWAYRTPGARVVRVHMLKNDLLAEEADLNTGEALFTWLDSTGHAMISSTELHKRVLLSASNDQADQLVVVTSDNQLLIFDKDIYKFTAIALSDSVTALYVDPHGTILLATYNSGSGAARLYQYIPGQDGRRESRLLYSADHRLISLIKQTGPTLLLAGMVNDEESFVVKMSAQEGAVWEKFFSGSVPCRIRDIYFADSCYFVGGYYHHKEQVYGFLRALSIDGDLLPFIDPGPVGGPLLSDPVEKIDADSNGIQLLSDGYSHQRVLTLGLQPRLYAGAPDRPYLPDISLEGDSADQEERVSLLETMPAGVRINKLRSGGKNEGRGSFWLVGAIAGDGLSLGLFAVYTTHGDKKEVILRGTGNVDLTDMAQDAAGNYFILGTNGIGACLVSLNRDLSHRWTVDLPGSHASLGNSLTVSDSTILVGTIDGEGSSLYNVSESSAIRWKRDVSGFVFDTRIHGDTTTVLIIHKMDSTSDNECSLPVIETLYRGELLSINPAPYDIGCNTYFSSVPLQGGNGFVTACANSFSLDSSYVGVFGQLSLVDGVVCRWGEDGALLWKKALGFRPWTICNQIDELPDGKLLAAFKTTEDSVHYESLLVLLDRDGHFAGRTAILPLKQVLTFCPLDDGRVLMAGLDSAGDHLLLMARPGLFGLRDPFWAGANERVAAYLDASQKMDKQIINQSDIDERRPFDVRIAANVTDPASMRAADEEYEANMKEYNSRRQQELVFDAWTDPAKLSQSSLGLIRLAKSEMEDTTAVFPGLRALTYKAYGLKMIDSDPVGSESALQTGFVLAKRVFGDTSVYITDYYEGLKAAAMVNSNLYAAENIERKIISIFERQRQMNENLQALYIRALDALAIIYSLTGRPSDAEQILNKAVRYAYKLEDADVLLSQARVLLAALEIRKGADHAQRALQMMEPVEQIGESDLSPDMVIEILSAKMIIYFYLHQYDKSIAVYYTIRNKIKALYGEKAGDMSFMYDYVYVQCLRLTGDLDNAKTVAFDMTKTSNKVLEKVSAYLSSYLLALVYQGESKRDSALGYIRKAEKGLQQFSDVSSSNEESRQLLEMMTKPFFTDYLKILQDTMQRVQDPMPLLDESLLMAQKAGQTATAKSISIMSEKFSQRNNMLGHLLKEADSLSRKIIVTETGLRNAMVKKSFTSPFVQKLYNQSEELHTSYASVRQTIREQFPQFSYLTNQDMARAEDIRAVLQPSEAVLLYHIGDSTSFGWVLTKDQSQFFRIDLNHEEVERLVMNIRKTADPDNVLLRGVGGKTKPGPQKNTALNVLLPFATGDAYTLYTALIRPAEAFLQGKTSLLVIPDGPLFSIPFGLFLTKPASPVKKAADYASLSWLGLQYGLSVWPSIASIKELRTEKTVSKEHRLPFVGFGDPDFSGTPGGLRGYNLNILFRNSERAINQQELKKLPRLPETAQELKEIAQSLGADEKYVYLGKNASERTVKSLDLTRFKVIAFSTHGFAAGDMEGITEPSLALSPPVVPGPVDDGVLTASEIAQLSTAADWVILSACNTASSDGTKGSENLSGLARAFFYSGSKSLLVTSWPVASGPTALLVAQTLQEMQRNKGLSRDEALRLAIRTLMFDKSQPMYAHPMFWAPFTIVGERLGVN